MSPTSSPAPAYVVEATVRHRRTRPFDYSFEHRTTSWLVDADDASSAFPRWMRPFMRIRGRDHLGEGDGALRDKLVTWLRDNDVPWSAHSVRVLVNARTAGYVFDPLTTWFCFDAEGHLEGILAEVHNTYGGRHCYPLSAVHHSEPATKPSAIRSSVDKAFYVSPFFAVEGRYDIKARLTDDQVTVTITLTHDDQRVFTGSVHGALVPATRRAVVRAWVRNPFASQRVAALIRWHGIRLWLRRLPVVPRPSSHSIPSQTRKGTS